MHIKRLVPTAVFALSLFSLHSAKAQIGAKVSLLSPLSDFGATFKKGPAYELYYVSGDGKHQFVSQIGFSYTSLKPRLDTFSTYMVGFPNGGPVILPGYETYRKFTMTSVYFDFGIRIIQLQKLQLLIFLGLEGGINHIEYSRGYETMLAEDNARIDQDFAGLRTRLNLNYVLSKHAGIYLEYMNRLTTLTNWSAQFPSNNVGVGFNYYFKAQKQ